MFNLPNLIKKYVAMKTLISKINILNLFTKQDNSKSSATYNTCLSNLAANLLVLYTRDTERASLYLRVS